MRMPLRILADPIEHLEELLASTRLGVQRKEGYVFTRRSLLSVAEYLASPVNAGRPALELFREALTRYYVSRVTGDEDRQTLLELLDAAGIGPNTWQPGA